MIIIMNSKSALDSALKCFVFFLISQPLVYIVQLPFSNIGTQILSYYKNWIGWTILTFIMGFVGYYMKKDKWWGVLILLPMLAFLAEHAMGFLSKTIFWFPHHLLSFLLCIAAMFGLVFLIFTDKKARIIGTVFSAVLTVAIVAVCIVNPPVYKTTFAVKDSADVELDNTYAVALADKRYGDVEFIYDEGIESYLVSAKFKKAGKTELILTAPDGTKLVYDLTIGYDNYDLKLKQ